MMPKGRLLAVLGRVDGDPLWGDEGRQRESERVSGVFSISLVLPLGQSPEQ